MECRAANFYTSSFIVSFDKPLYSSFSALNGFADLMGFGETSPLTTENEGLDSGLGEAPLTSQQKIKHVVDTEMVVVTEKTTTPHKMGASLLGEESTQPPDDTQPQTVRKLSRKRNKKELAKNKILDEKQQRSMEKVAEWLMKVPTEGSLELEKLNSVDGDSDSCSSSSTIDVRPHSNVLHQSKREQTKALEDQVFGAVYRRDRKSTWAVPPLHDNFNRPDQAGSESVSSEKSGRNIEERLEAAEEKKANSSDVLGEELIEDYGGQIAENEEAPDHRQQLVRKTKSRMQNSVQQVDSDLLQQAEAKPQISKRRNKKRGQNLRSEKGKSVSETKPLELVPLQNEETGPPTRPRSEDVQVHIENYPSSEDQELPSKRITRRSRRIQVFTETIRSSRRNGKSNVDSKEEETKFTEQPNETEGKLLEEKTLRNTGAAAKDPERNGCVCNEDLGGIENMEAGGKDPISDVANSENFPEGSAARDPALLSPSEVAISPTNHLPNSTQLDTAVCDTPQAAGEEDKEEKEEEDRNDSELDTEQLLRSFKGTKRKSFHLGGGPSVKRSRSADETELRRCDDDSLDVSGGREELRVRTTPEAVEVSGQRSCENLSADVISPSISPRRMGNPVLEESHQEAMCVDLLSSKSQGTDAIGAKSASSPLPPNIQSKRCDADSLCPSMEPRVGESGLYFVSVDQSHHADVPLSLYKTGGDRPHHSEQDETDRNSSHSSKLPAEKIASEESLTPDGLGPAVEGNSQQEAKKWRSSCSGKELSGLSPLKSAARKRSRRLQSTSESSDCTGDGLPTLAEICGGPVPAGTPDQRGQSSPGCRREEQEDMEEQSSQVSVDLFGTPEEGKVSSMVTNFLW